MAKLGAVDCTFCTRAPSNQFPRTPVVVLNVNVSMCQELLLIAVGVVTLVATISEPSVPPLPLAGFNRRVCVRICVPDAGPKPYVNLVGPAETGLLPQLLNVEN